MNRERGTGAGDQVRASSVGPYLAFVGTQLALESLKASVMELSAAEVAIIEAFSHYVLDGKLDLHLTVGELIAQTGLSAVYVNAALSRLLGRSWLIAPTKYLWEDDDEISLCGEGLARAASLATRRELTLFQLNVGGFCFYVSYEQARRERGPRIWVARAHRSDLPGSAPEVSAVGIARAKARDALRQKLTEALHQPCDPP